MLPQPDVNTLRRYLLSVSQTISKAVNQGLNDEAAVRLRECATVTARVAQQLGQSPGMDWPDIDWDLAAEAHALDVAQAAFAQEEEARLVAGLAPPSTRARSIDARAVETYLRAHPLGGEAVRVSEARLLAGGRCKLTALVTQDGAANLPASFILRQDWDGGATDTTVAEEYDLLAGIVVGGVRAPEPLLIEAGTSIVGAPFILVERKPGGLAGSLFTPPKSPALVLQFAEQLGRIHGLAADRFGDPQQERRDRQDRLPRQLEAFRAQHATVGIRSRIVDGALDWLSAHLEDAGDTVTLTHNDLGFHNALVEGDTLVALLDWELARLGHPAEDLGYIRHFVEQVMPWDDFVARYQEHGGWQMEDKALRFFTIWSGVRLYGLIAQARAAIAAGIVDDMEITFACADNLMLLLHHLGRQMVEAQAVPAGL